MMLQFAATDPRAMDVGLRNVMRLTGKYQTCCGWDETQEKTPEQQKGIHRELNQYVVI